MHMNYIESAGHTNHKNCMFDLLLFVKEPFLCTTFALRPTVGCAIQLTITKCIMQSQSPSHTMCAIEIPHIPLFNTIYIYTNEIPVRLSH